MGQSIEEVLNRLVAVEDAAQQMQDAVDAQKKELAAQMEEKKKQKAAAEVPVEFTTEEEIDEDVLYVIVAAVCSDLRNNPL